MTREDPLSALMDAERRVRMDSSSVESGWRRLDRAVRTDKKASSVVMVPLSLSFSLLSTKAVAAALALGVSSAVATGLWVYERTPARSPAVETQTRGHTTGFRKRGADRAPARPTLQPPVDAGLKATSPGAPPSSHFEDSAEPRGASSSTKPSGVQVDSSGLVEEISLIRNAKGELDRGNTSAASRWLAEHAGRFPDGTLADEREALRLVLSCSSAPGPTSRAAALRYVRAFPRSLHRARIARACQLPAAEIPAARFETGSE